MDGLDGQVLCFTGQRNKEFEIFTGFLHTRGGKEVQLNYFARATDDGPEYTGWQKYIYFSIPYAQA